MKLNTQHLKYAVEIERCGSITRAAEKLFINQPHLSKTIRELEDSLGIVIFKRTSKGVFPTKKGEKLLAYAKKILNELEHMDNILRDEDVREVSFTIAVPRASYISCAFSEFVMALPKERALNLSYRETNSVNAIRDVADRESDLGIIRFQAGYENYFKGLLREKKLRFEPINSFEYWILMSIRHPLAVEVEIDASMLKEYILITQGDEEPPFLAPSRDKTPQEGLGDTKAKGGEISICERGSQLELLERIPLAYMWASPVPQEVLKRFDLTQRRCITPNNSHKDFLIYRNDYDFSDEDKLFIEKLHTAVKTTVFE